MTLKIFHKPDPMKHEKQNINGSRIQDNQRANPKLTLLEAYSLLSRSECRVLKKMAEGKTNSQIAEELFISLKTVENHITNIGNKLQIKGWGKLRKWLRNAKS